MYNCVEFGFDNIQTKVFNYKNNIRE